MKKKCLSCGRSFGLSGSGKRQKYCSKTCRNNGNGGLSIVGTEGGSNPLKTKAAKQPSVRQQVEAQKGQPNPISFITPEGQPGRVWLAGDLIGDDRHWRVNLHEAAKVDFEAGKGVQPAATLGDVWATELPPPLRGIRVRLLFEDEAPEIGSGQRLVVCQLRGKRVVLHHACYTAAIKRDAFKDLLAANKCHRKRHQPKPALRLVVSNPARLSDLAEAA